MKRLWNRFRSSRGAALPEYALVFSILLGGSLVLYQSLEDKSQVTVEDNASAIGALPTIEGFAIPDGTSGTTSTTAAPTTTSTTTTIAPTTTTPATTTTAAPTTTAPTTTVAPGWVTTFTDQSASYWSNGCSCTRYRARWSTHIEDTSGVPLSNGWVRWRIQTDNGSDFTTGWYQFNGNGDLTLTWSNRRSYHFPITVSIYELEEADYTPITSNPSSLTIALPS